MTSLEGKTVFITGASSGIGRATAKAFAAEGARLLLCARRLDPLTELAASLQVESYCLRLDVQDRDAVLRTLADLPEPWQSIDVLVNNAGLSRDLSKLIDNNPTDWDEMLDTNVKGLLAVTKAVVPGMLARGAGHVVNLGSTAGHYTYAGGAVYCASKAAERVLTEALRLELNGTPVRVTSVDPGMVETAFSEVRFRGDRERAAKVYQGLTPLAAEDVADAIVWAASRPPHVMIQTIVMTSIDQATSTVVHRRS